MKEKLSSELKQAMKARDKGRAETIRSLLSALQYKEVETGKEPLPEEVSLAVVKSELKKRKEELDFAQKAGRTETAEEVKSQIAFIEDCLPQQLSEEDLKKIIGAMVQEGAAGSLGDVMKSLKERYHGQYDGKLASSVARKALEQS